MDEVLIQQMGLLLTQLRYARRSLEDIERSTARYTGFAFAGALSAGAGFGAPPMLGGALKVHIVNINDLAPGGGATGLLEGLLGGFGRFFGGLFGGLVGGTIGGVALPVMIAQVEKIAGSVERIIAQLGVKIAPDADPKKAAEPTVGGSGGGGFLDNLDKIKGFVDSFTALFQASNDSPKETKTANSMMPEPKGWLAVLQTADSLIRGITLVIKGMILLIPEVIGALALLISKLDSIKLAVVDLLQFLLREALLLRGVVLTVIFDTIASAAKLAANILSIAGVTIQDVITSVFKIFDSVLDAALAAISFLGDGLARTIDALLKWLVDSVTTTLAVIGQTRVFSFAVYAIQTLPYILPSLVRLVRDNATGYDDRKALNQAKMLSLAQPGSTGAPTFRLPEFPKVSATLLDPAAVGTLKETIEKSLGSITTLLRDLFGDSEKGVRKLANQLDNAAGDKVFNETFDKHVGALRGRAKELSETLDPARVKAKEAVDSQANSGLGLIAKAYEDWLGSPTGLKSLLGNITDFIKQSPTTGPEAEKTVAARTVGPTVVDCPRATVEIDDLVIELSPPSDSKRSSEVPGIMKSISDYSPEEFLQAVVELIHEMDQRGLKFGTGSPLMQI